jgi:hypothetical protein
VAPRPVIDIVVLATEPKSANLTGNLGPFPKPEKASSVAIRIGQ